MRVELGEVARNDLRAIRAYYSAISPRVENDILDDVFATFDAISTLPRSGREIRQKVRKNVSPKYRFVILSRPVEDYIEITAIFRQQDRL